MLSKNSYGCFDERPQDEARQSLFRVSLLIAKVIERLLHGLSKLFLERSWIERDQSLIESTDYALVIRHRFLETVFFPALKSQCAYSDQVLPRALLRQRR